MLMTEVKCCWCDFEFLEYEDRMNATPVGTSTASTDYWVSVILIEVQDVLNLG